MKNEIKNIFVIILKDLKAYYFKPATISWGILFPIVFVLIFAMKNGSHISSLIGGLLSMSMFFGSTSMTGTSIMMERKINVFNIYYTLPISYYGIALAKVLSGLLFGIFTALIMFLVSIIIVPIHIHNVSLFIVWILVSSFVFSSLGVYISLIVKEAYDAMIYLNLIRLPLIFISGIFMPIAVLPSGVKFFSYISPLTYSVAIADKVFMGKTFIGEGTSFLVLIVVGIFFLILSRNRVKFLRG